MEAVVHRPGAKAGGPDYVIQLGTWHDVDPTSAAGPLDDVFWWRTHYGVSHDPTGLFCEQNALRYLPRSPVVVRAGEHATPADVERTLSAARHAGVSPRVSASHADLLGVDGGVVEDDATFAAGLGALRFGRVRHVGRAPAELWSAATDAEVDVIDEPVVASGRLEMRWYLQEQAISRTLHRFGNLIGGASDQQSLATR